MLRVLAKKGWLWLSVHHWYAFKGFWEWLNAKHTIRSKPNFLLAAVAASSSHVYLRWHSASKSIWDNNSHLTLR